MKLTEAQLKRIIEEEVQRAIEEGIFDRIKSAVGSFAGGAKKTGDAGQEALDAGLSVVAKGDQAIVDAIYAARQGKDKKLIYKTSEMVNKLIEPFERLAALKTPEAKEALRSYFELLSNVAGMNLSTLGKKVSSARREYAAMAAAEQGDNPSGSRRRSGPEGIGSRLGSYTSSLSGFNESKVEEITEAIMKRISQKR
jgi:hypothetical protein